MNRKIAISFVFASIAVVGSAFAETPMVDTTPFKSALTRDQVKAELAQHRKSGVNPYADDYNQLTDFRSTRTRAEVKAEFLASRDMVSALGSEDSGSAYLIAHRKQPITEGPQLASAPADSE